MRRRSGGLALNPGLPEHTPKKRRTKEPTPLTEGPQFSSALGNCLEQAVKQLMTDIASSNEESAKGSNVESAKGSNEESAKGSGDKETGVNNDPASTKEGSSNSLESTNGSSINKWGIFEENAKGSPQNWVI